MGTHWINARAEERRKARIEGVIGGSEGAEVEAENELRAQKAQCVSCVMMVFAKAFKH